MDIFILLPFGIVAITVIILYLFIKQMSLEFNAMQASWGPWNKRRDEIIDYLDNKEEQ